MLDIRLIRENPELVKRSAREKGYDEAAIDELLKRDESRRSLQQEVDDLRQKRNALIKSFGSERPSEDKVREAQDIKSKLLVVEETLSETQALYDQLLASIPNIIFDDVPLGGEHDSVEVKRWGDNRASAVDHVDFATSRGWLDFERGAKVAGSKFYFLKGDFALLENAITQYALTKLTQRGFTFMTVPHMVNQRTATGAGFSPKDDSASNEYSIQGEDLILIGTAEAPLTGFHADEIINESDLPIRYVGLSPSYRREAGTYGKHTRGLFRVHQFSKLEMYIFTTPEKSSEAHGEILALEEEIWQELGIPYHVVNIAAGDLGAPAAKKYDIEYWSPVDQEYRELTSTSNCTDFQARNLNIRVRRTDGPLEVLHTLNGTAVALARTLVAIIENYQNDDGTLTVPEALRSYMGGRDRI